MGIRDRPIAVQRCGTIVTTPILRIASSLRPDMIFGRDRSYITKEARDRSRLATVVQLDPIHVIGQAPAAMYFQRGGGVLKTLEQTSAQREFALVLPTGDKYPHKGRL